MFKKLEKIFIVILISGLSVLLVCSLANSIDFPKKPVKIIITTEPGGGEDSDGRALAPFLQKYLGVTVLIENQPGAGGKIAFEKFQRAEPNGYSITLYNFPKSIIIEYMGKVNFRTKDFTPLYAWNRSNQLMVVHADTWKTFNEFYKSAKAKTLSGGIMGRGSTTHLAALIALEEFEIKVNWVPYEGHAGALAALAGKHLDFIICLSASATALIEAGKLRPLLLLGDIRDPYLPDVPIPKDLGFNITSFFPAMRCAFAPPNTPPAIVKVWEEAFSKAVKEPAYIEWAKKRWIALHSLNAQEFGKVVQESYSSIERFKHILKE